MAAVAASICIAASALVVFWQSTAGLRGGTGSQHPVLDELDQQFSHSFWDIGTQVRPSTLPLLLWPMKRPSSTWTSSGTNAYSQYSTSCLKQNCC